MFVGCSPAQVCNWKSCSWRQAQRLGSERRWLRLNEEVSNVWVIRSGEICRRRSRRLFPSRSRRRAAAGRCRARPVSQGAGWGAEPRHSQERGLTATDPGLEPPGGTWPRHCTQGWHWRLRATSGWDVMSLRKESAQPGLPVPLSDLPRSKTAVQNSRAKPRLG